MSKLHIPHRRLLPACCLLSACSLLTGCWPTPYEWRHENQWDSREQIGMAEASQVKLRSAQSRVFDTVNTQRILEAVVSTMQDLNFTVQVLDEELGLVSGKQLLELERPGSGLNLFYNLYDDQRLLIFSRNYLNWGPFWHRDDLLRLTVTVRKRNETQSVVRANAQFYLKAVENPEPYQRFFNFLEKTLFLEAHLFKEPG
jgi:hypothetical protein